MRILIINDTLTMGGKERRLVELLTGLQDYPDVTCGLALFARPEDYPEIRKAFPQIFEMNVELFFLERKNKKDLSLFKKFYKVYKEFNPDLVHSWGAMSSIYSLPSVILKRKKIISAIIADAPKDMGWSDSRYSRAQLVYPFSDLILANSKAGLRAYKAPLEKSDCVYNGFDFRRINQLPEKSEVLQRLGIQTPYTIAMIAGFFERKDFATYVKAAQLVLDKREDVTFLAIGEGPTLEQIKAMVAEKHRDRILFPGHQKRVEETINILDIGILSTNSLVHGEGISNSILECMALAKPIIASSGGGTDEIVVHGETGYLVQPSQAEELSQRIHELLDNADLRESMGIKSHERVYKHFNLDQMARRYYDIYQNVLNN